MSTRVTASGRKGSGKDRKGASGSASRARGSAGRDREDDASGSEDERSNAARASAVPSNENMPLIMFDQSKNELKQLNPGFKQLQNKLRAQYRFVANKDEITRDKLEGVRAIVFGGAREKFESSEIKVLQEFLAAGGGVLLAGSEPTEPVLEDPQDGGDEPKSMAPDDYTGVNRLSENFGLAFNNDALVRTVYAKEFYHPKEVLIKSAAMVPSMNRIAEDRPVASKDPKAGPVEEDDSDPKLELVYPFGCTLRVAKPATPLISSGVLTFPAQRALAGCARVGRGTLVLLGSVQMLADEHLTKADNFLFVSNLIGRATGAVDWKPEPVDGDRAEFQEAVPVPDTEALAERLRCCLQETEELPVDFTTLFDHTLFKYDTHLIPEAVKLYERLNVKHEALSLIPPQFEVPLPPLQPAVFMPCMRELPPPALDLFDLDEHFSSEKLRLAQLTNKCSDADLEYFVCEAGEILGIADQIRALPGAAGKYSANKVLEFILRKLVDWKKLDRDADAGGPPMGGGYDQGLVSPNGSSQSFVMPEQLSPQQQQRRSKQPAGGHSDSQRFEPIDEFSGERGNSGGGQRQNDEIDMGDD
jgi:intraflagellar transport protein 52